MKQLTLILFLIACTSPAIGLPGESDAVADRINVRGGAVLTGHIESVSNNVIRLKTPYAGVIEVELKQVEHVTSPRPLKGIVPEKLLAEAAPEPVVATPPTVATAVAAAKAKGPPMRREGWTVEAGMDLSGKRGNTDKSDFTVTIDSRLQRKFDRFDLYGRYAYGTNKDKVSSDEIVAGGRYTNFFYNDVGLFVREEIEHDVLEGLTYRSTTATGLSWKIQSEEELNVEARTGISYRYDDYAEDGYEDYPGMDLGMDILWKFTDWAKFKGSYTVLPSVANSEDYILEQDSSVDFSLDYWNRWSLRFGVWSKYNNVPDIGREKLDVRYYARVISSWK